MVYVIFYSRKGFRKELFCKHNVTVENKSIAFVSYRTRELVKIVPCNQLYLVTARKNHYIYAE